MTQPDSLSLSSTSATTATPAVAKHRMSTPHEIISSLPATATPWQQDSAIRANIKFENIDWSRRPNPMRTPTTKVDNSHFTLNKPLYHVRSLVQPDSIYRPEYATYRLGVAGDPVPYTIATDNIITSLLLACFIFGTLAIVKSGHILIKQFKHIFYTGTSQKEAVSETSNELRFQLFLVMQTCLLGALIFFLYVRHTTDDELSIEHYKSIGLFAAILLAYFALKGALQSIVQWVFFGRKKIEQWTQFYLFTISLEGLSLFPAVMLMVYFNLPVETTGFYTLGIVILLKLLTLYKAHCIFFSREQAYLQSFLYFCALELMPMGALWGILMMTVNYLKVNI